MWKKNTTPSSETDSVHHEILDIDFIGFTAIYHIICRTGMADWNWNPRFFFWLSTIDKREGTSAQSVPSSRKIRQATCKQHHTTKVTISSEKEKNITWLVRFQCTLVVKQNINWRVYVTWSEPKYQPTFSCSFPGKQAFPLDRFRGRTPWIHSRFRQGSMQAKQRFRIVSAESLDCVFLTSILWGRKTMKVKGFMISKIRKG